MDLLKVNDIFFHEWSAMNKVHEEPAMQRLWSLGCIHTLLDILGILEHRCPFPIGWLINRGVCRNPLNNG